MLTAVIGFLRNELVDRLYHHIATEALLSQLLLGHVVQLMLPGKVVDSSFFFHEATNMRRQFLASQVLQEKVHRVQSHMG